MPSKVSMALLLIELDMNIKVPVWINLSHYLEMLGSEALILPMKGETATKF